MLESLLKDLTEASEAELKAKDIIESNSHENIGLDYTVKLQSDRDLLSLFLKQKQPKDFVTCWNQFLQIAYDVDNYLPQSFKTSPFFVKLNNIFETQKYHGHFNELKVKACNLKFTNEWPELDPLALLIRNNLFRNEEGLETNEDIFEKFLEKDPKRTVKNYGLHFRAIQKVKEASQFEQVIENITKIKANAQNLIDKEKEELMKTKVNEIEKLNATLTNPEKLVKYLEKTFNESGAGGKFIEALNKSSSNLQISFNKSENNGNSNKDARTLETNLEKCKIVLTPLQFALVRALQDEIKKVDGQQSTTFQFLYTANDLRWAIVAVMLAPVGGAQDAYNKCLTYSRLKNIQSINKVFTKNYSDSLNPSLSINRRKPSIFAFS